MIGCGGSGVFAHGQSVRVCIDGASVLAANRMFGLEVDCEAVVTSSGDATVDGNDSGGINPSHSMRL